MEYQLTLADVDKAQAGARRREKGQREQGATRPKSGKDGGKEKDKRGPTEGHACALNRGRSAPTCWRRKTPTAAEKTPPAVDPIKNESLNILADMVDQQRHPKLAKTRD